MKFMCLGKLVYRMFYKESGTVKIRFFIEGGRQQIRPFIDAKKTTHTRCIVF